MGYNCGAMNKIRLALCITELDIGGAERCLTELAVRLDRRRFEPVVYSLGPEPKDENASCAPRLKAADVETHFLNARSVWQFPVVGHRLKNLLLSQHPHVVQTFLFHANILGRIAARRAGVPAVVSGIRVAERAARWHLRLDRLTQRWVDRYVCVSRSVADFSARDAGLPAEKLVVIPNGIDSICYPAATKTDLRQFGIAAGRRAIVFVGRLERQKGVEWLVEMSPQWLNALPDCDLLLVGEGPLREQLAARSETLGVAERVHFAGWRPDVPGILASAALLTLPSAWEGMPNVVLEAMATGLPVLATSVEGVQELLGPAADAQTVRYGDTPAFLSRLSAILQDADSAVALGEANRRRVEQEFDLARCVAAYESLWMSLVQ